MKSDRAIALGLGLVAVLTGAAGDTRPSASNGIPVVRIIYLVPSDRVPQEGYRLALEKTIREMQAFYGSQLGGKTFLLHDPVVEIVRTQHPLTWFQTDAPGSSDAGRYWESILDDGFHRTGGRFNDPMNRWIFFIDADPLCGQYEGGTSGVALLSANDMRGQICDGNYDDCVKGPSDLAGPCRWVGGLGHELGHSFNLPHPTPGTCPDPDSSCSHALMWTGYGAFPNAYLLPSDEDSLLHSVETRQFFVDFTPPPLDFACSDGCPPERPEGLTAVALGNVVDLQWPPSADATGYAIWRGAAEFDSPVLIADGLAAPSYVDSSVVIGETYWYRVTASNAIGISGNSNAASTIVAPPPARLQIRPGRGNVHPRSVDRP